MIRRGSDNYRNIAVQTHIKYRPTSDNALFLIRYWHTHLRTDRNGKFDS
jgi:hypothetical protein